MSPDTAHRLNALNAAFYRENAASFSATRHAGWPGWERCWQDARKAGIVPDPQSAGASGQAKPVRILDLACGNLRFARFIRDAAPGIAVDYQAADDCSELAGRPEVPGGWSLNYRQLDIVESLLAGSFGQDLAVACREKKADLLVCFGFLHHVPTMKARRDLLRALLAATRPGGLCCISFWRFMSEPRLAARARETTAEASEALGISRAELDPGDCLLGWQNVPGAWRYCHHFDDEEIDALADAVGDQDAVVDRFASDGRTGSLNGYLVLRRQAATEPAARTHAGPRASRPLR